MRKRGLKTIQILAAFLLALIFFGDAAADIPSAARREAARLERLAINVWEGMLDDVSFGYSIDQRTRLGVFNFVNGTRYLKQKAESRRTQPKELSEVVGLLLLQSQTVDRSLRIGKTRRALLRDWEEAKASLVSLDRLLHHDREPFARRRDAPRARENINDLSIEIKKVSHSGNIFKNKYRIRGTISGRNIVSAGIYYKERLLKSVSVRLHERRFTENPFKLSMEAPGGDAILRVIDNRGFVLEEPIDFPAGGLFPGFK